ncbi:MAG: pyruvate:ferredoxin (flavodoxin) oxidoreductase [Gammaproteobacteria bacterium]|nr:pyruvate:ferredoxin (flavodoxin) oxidoreductase [Gammaproteobacteria bacterium]
MTHSKITIDGNEAAAFVAHQINEVIAIYPITPASPMGEISDERSARGLKNIWGVVPDVIEMQSEGGAAGTVHGALQAGALTTTFTASQGLLLMIPNMYKIAGELSPTVIHVAARSLAAQALSIFGDHQDVMAARQTGFAMLASNSVQEVMDFALISQVSSLKSRIPFMHFFDGFRTSHEVAKIDAIDLPVFHKMLSDEPIQAHRDRALTPDKPVIRGTSQNPDVYFQARESVNTIYNHAGDVVQQTMDEFAELTGRQYQLMQYEGAEDADRLIILMGSGAETVDETVEHLTTLGEKVGVLKVRLFRPFPIAFLLAAMPDSTRKIAVLDRTKEPGSAGEPLYQDVVTAVMQDYQQENPRFKEPPLIVGGRFGLSSKEFTPGMVKGVFDELSKERPKNNFTVGIKDDVTHSNLDWQADYLTKAIKQNVNCLFYGLGSDGTVSANKNSIKIIGEQPQHFAQGYFVYDSKKAGAVTVSHLRFGPKPIKSAYLIGDDQAQFVACHQPQFVEKYDMLAKAMRGATFLLNTSVSADKVWSSLPENVQQQIIDKELKFWVIDAYKVASLSGMGRRINTVMQTCFFAISNVLLQEEAIAAIKSAVEKTYGRKGRKLVAKNFAAIDATLEKLYQVEIPQHINGHQLDPIVPENAPAFVHQVTAPLIAGLGDELPVSVLPIDGTYPLGTAAYEKRKIALEIPIWDEDLCIHCGKCPFVCPHAAIRSKIVAEEELVDAPKGFKHVKIKGKEFADNLRMIYQVAPEDCTGCGLCVEICPAKDKSNVSHKALNMELIDPYFEEERRNWDFFLQLPEYDRAELKMGTMKHVMATQPLFEFSGACSGCGETPYIKLATQLFGDRMMIANATGCSSIYGGNLPTTPYTTDPNGRGPTWSNSLFEDNAEFALGMRMAVDHQANYASILLKQLEAELGAEFCQSIIDADQSTESGIYELRQKVETLKQMLQHKPDESSQRLLGIADYLVKKSVWSIGGDGWAYDIGFGGLDHVMASGRNVNILILDTEVYSNTGGQQSKATPTGAVAKFAASGKSVGKKDLGMIAMAYEHVYVASVAFGAKDVHTIRTFLEAEAYDGPSVIIAYSPCIAHGYEMIHSLNQQQLAVNSGHWGLYRFDPRKLEKKENPLSLDSKKPSVNYSDFTANEARFSMLKRSHPEVASELALKSQAQADKRWQHYQQLADLSYSDNKEEK